MGPSRRSTRGGTTLYLAVYRTTQHLRELIKETITITDNNDTAAPILWLRGDKVALGPFVRDLVPLYWRWETEPRALLGYGQQYAETLQTRDDVFTSQSRDGSPYFTIYDLTTEHPTPVGISNIIVDNRTRTGELVIILGPEGRGKGLAAEATRLTVDYGFHITNLRNIYLSVLAPNVAGIRAYEKAGFKMMGRRRNSGYWLGEIADHVFMDIIPEDFPGPSMLKQDLGAAPQ